jgi:hypothetical protein
MVLSSTFDLFHHCQLTGNVRSRSDGTLRREADVLYSQRRSVMERDPLPELEAPRQRIDVRPFRRKRRLKIHLTVTAQQRLVHVSVEGADKAVAASMRIHCRGIAVIGPAKGLGFACRRGQSEHRYCGHDMPADPNKVCCHREARRYRSASRTWQFCRHRMSCRGNCKSVGLIFAPHARIRNEGGRGAKAVSSCLVHQFHGGELGHGLFARRLAVGRQVPCRVCPGQWSGPASTTSCSRTR